MGIRNPPNRTVYQIKRLVLYIKKQSFSLSLRKKCLLYKQIRKNNGQLMNMSRDTDKAKEAFNVLLEVCNKLRALGDLW